jgi:uncharacterized protein Yka (UPF0111/DUF47 family)
MGLSKKIKMLLSGNSEHDFVEILSGQADFLRRSTQMLVEMFQDGLPLERRKEIEREIKALENQGDAMLTEFHGQLAANRVISVNKLDLQAISMAMDDCLDAIKDTSKAVLIYRPHRIDPQLQDLARLAAAQSEALCEMVPQLEDIKTHLSAISLCCDRVTELEHAADESYEDYIGCIFEGVDDTRELIKYKNLAEMLENVTDVHKRISDNTRKLLLNYFI